MDDLNLNLTEEEAKQIVQTLRDCNEAFLLLLIFRDIEVNSEAIEEINKEIDKALQFLNFKNNGNELDSRN